MTSAPASREAEWVMPDRTEPTWTFEPANLFEVPYEANRGDASLRVFDGTAVVTVPGGSPDASRETEFRTWIRNVLRVRGLQTGRPQAPADEPSIVEFENGRRNIFVRMKAGVITVEGGSVDFVHTDATGQVVRDTKAERRTAHRNELDDLTSKPRKARCSDFFLIDSASHCENPRLNSCAFMKFGTL